jgi:hypothetical protein
MLCDEISYIFGCDIIFFLLDLCTGEVNIIARLAKLLLTVFKEKNPSNITEGGH